MEDRNTEYKDANALPSVIKLKSQIRIAKAFCILLPQNERKKMCDSINITKKKLLNLIGLVNKFYNLLSKKHWIFLDTFPPSDIKEILDTNDAETAEKRLIAWYSKAENIEKSLLHLTKQVEFESRMPLIRKALEDFTAQRYYSTVYILLSQVDGIVNNANPQLHRSLSSKAGHDLFAYDSAVSIANALPKVANIYKKKFEKFSNENVNELYRNGIMHGQLINFDNITVASKAWNLLFAIFDWLEASEKYEKHEDELNAPKMGMQDVRAKLKCNEDIQHGLDEWKPYETNVLGENDPSGIKQDCINFFNAWKGKNYMKVGHYLPNMSKLTPGRMAAEAKNCFSEYPISDYKLQKIENVAPSSAYITVHISPDQREEYATRLHWTRVKSPHDFKTAFPGEEGIWVMTHYEVDPFRPNSNM